MDERTMEEKKEEMMNKMLEKQILEEESRKNVAIINESAETEESKKLTLLAYDTYVKGKIEKSPELGADIDALKKLYSTALDLVKAEQELAEKKAEIAEQKTSTGQTPNPRRQVKTSTDGTQNKGGDSVTEEELIAMVGQTKANNIVTMLKMINND